MNITETKYQAIRWMNDKMSMYRIEKEIIHRNLEVGPIENKITIPF